MTLDITFDINNDIATMTLSGELDRNTSDLFKSKIEAATQTKLSRLVLMMEDLTYMASAGLRVLIFAKQKMGPESEIHIVGAQEIVLDTIKKTGFHHSVTLLDTLEEDN
ncbi:MAG: anti-sigma factor antagonist [Microcoleaceae cyanobacterium]